MRARGSGSHRVQGIPSSDSGFGRLGPAQLLDLPGSVPPLCRCVYRQHIIPPFKRKDTAYTYRFEQFVLRSLIGSTSEDVARRLGISAETVERIVENQLAEDRVIDPQRDHRHRPG